jgi:DNA-binding Xre family transcriptional regulator
MECNNVTGQCTGATLNGVISNDMEKYITELNATIKNLEVNMAIKENDLNEKIETVGMLENYVLEITTDKAEAIKEMGLRLLDICKKHKK